MTAININYEQFKGALVELAGANPEHVYKQEHRDADNMLTGEAMCENVSQDVAGNWVGSCLIGQALVKLGVPAAALVPVREDSFGRTAEHLEEEGIVAFAHGWDYAALAELAKRAQMSQDRGIAWGEAVAKAIPFADRIGEAARKVASA